MIGNLEIIDRLANSDHYMISCSVHFGNDRDGGDREVLDYRKADFESMREELRMVSWDELLDGNIHEAYGRDSEIG